MHARRTPAIPLALALAMTGACLGSRQSAVPPAATDERFALPFPVGDSAKLIQGNNGPYGHTDAAAYAFDFIMPIGSPVTAARDGEVVAAMGSLAEGTRSPGTGNHVVVRHADGTFARYFHLTAGGALRRRGDRVARGDIIGRSGNTGASAGPHLHFDVTRDCFEWGCQTVPIRFANAGADSLVQGHTYRARRVEAASPR